MYNIKGLLIIMFNSPFLLKSNENSPKGEHSEFSE